VIDKHEVAEHVRDLRSYVPTEVSGVEMQVITAVVDAVNHHLRALSDRICALENQVAELKGGSHGEE
jgi:hypothetical protein